MYIPTSKAAKFKAKGWIDLFGGRAAKAGGSAVNNVLAKMSSAFQMVQVGSLMSLGIIGIWIIAAFGVGTTFNKLTKEGKIIE
jgi:AAA family ATP:ADP antiporter